MTKSKFDNVYGIRHSLIDGLNRATDVLIGGKVALVCGFGDVGKGSAAALAGQGARVIVSEVDPICALQALLQGYQVARLEDVVDQADIVVTTTGNKDIVTVEAMARMKHQAIVANVGHFDNEIDVAGLARYPGIIRLNIKPQVDEWRFPDGHSIILLSEGRLMNLGNATGHPSFVMSNSFSNQVIAQVELFTKYEEYNKDVYRLPKILDEKVAKIHVLALGGELTKLSKDQAEYIGVDVEGPFKPEHYRVLSVCRVPGVTVTAGPSARSATGTGGCYGAAGLLLWHGAPCCCSTAPSGATTGAPGVCSAGPGTAPRPPSRPPRGRRPRSPASTRARYTVTGRFVDDHGGWSYTTVIARTGTAGAAPGAHRGDRRGALGAGGELAALPLHPGFAATWDRVRRSGQQRGRVDGDAERLDERQRLARLGPPRLDVEPVRAEPVGHRVRRLQLDPQVAPRSAPGRRGPACGTGRPSASRAGDDLRHQHDPVGREVAQLAVDRLEAAEDDDVRDRALVRREDHPDPFGDDQVGRRRRLEDVGQPPAGLLVLELRRSHDRGHPVHQLVAHPVVGQRVDVGHRPAGRRRGERNGVSGHRASHRAGPSDRPGEWGGG